MKSRNKWWTLKEDNAKVLIEKVVKEVDWQMTSNTEDTYRKMNNCISQIITKDI